MGMGSAFAGIIITVIPSIAPDHVDNQGNDPSTSYLLWQENALAALGTTPTPATTAGTAGTPSYYYQANSTTGMQNVTVTDSPFVGAWNGQVVTDPNSPYYYETGNQVRYGAIIQASGGTTFTLSQLGFNYTDLYTATTGDGIQGSFLPGSYTSFGTEFLAFNGTTPVTDPTLPLTELISSGSGFNTFPASCIFGDPTFGCDANGVQNLLNATPVNEGFDSDVVTGMYYIADPNTGAVLYSNSANFTITPEPSTWFLMISAVPVIGIIRRRRQQRG
jgi:hypothetical protein